VPGATGCRLRESAWLDELVALGGSISGKRKVVLAEKEVVGFAYLVRVIFALGVFAGLGVGGERRDRYEQHKGDKDTGGTASSSSRSRGHHRLPECARLQTNRKHQTCSTFTRSFAKALSECIPLPTNGTPCASMA
jgi:hypothetical protein